ncbi:hypothetical protein CLV98_1142 [Dyadobacter jejuensis]|uniref:Uncharacterized protein n=1 Tax=Dyadobacter jejuensis TaxID=1082580 RepID=A0A316AEC6_9BACT|nr:hypothetical protein CLV98_1142 [Dyadobacter jejuensis]
MSGILSIGLTNNWPVRRNIAIPTYRNAHLVILYNGLKFEMFLEFDKRWWSVLRYTYHVASYIYYMMGNLGGHRAG